MDPYIAEIRMFGGNFAPRGWAFCNGQILSIAQNTALFSLLGTTYGGNGQTTFALPNLRGRVPIHFGAHTLGEAAGATAVTITQQTMAQHLHFFQGSTANATAFASTGNVLARGTTAVGNNPINYYSQNTSNLVAMLPQEIGNVGGSQPHQNLMPYLVLNFIIALQGIFPSRN